MREWLLLIASLPTTTKTPRMRLWRALKACGAASLRDGVYVLPRTAASLEMFSAQARAIEAAGGRAQILPLAGLPEPQQNEFRGQFDRSAEYRYLLQTLQKFEREATRSTEGSARRRLAALRREATQLTAIDFFPTDLREQLENALSTAEAALNAAFSPGEPSPARTGLSRRDPADYRGRLWATRRSLWIDRVCSAWLIRRFIDAKARFLWLADPSEAPAKSVGFDFDGAAFTHVDGRVTFEVLVASFGLEQDGALQKLGALVHYLDVGGAPVAEAAGLETIMAGLRSSQTGDDQILAVMSPVLDGLYAGYGSSAKRARGANTKNKPRTRSARRRGPAE